MKSVLLSRKSAFSVVIITFLLMVNLFPVLAQDSADVVTATGERVIVLTNSCEEGEITEEALQETMPFASAGILNCIIIISPNSSLLHIFIRILRERLCPNCRYFWRYAILLQKEACKK